ncbi:hypothetical protein MKK75_14745 [Methylobacterium sp. J-030]|uniref:hypothetical protein n=1 Tax=Methylobacterium sp. J-030 TaxID=2836627 RepID=UPI001FB907C7|nr:hypothetical protein [Methylobacterium sp. J-030]MCJ2070037.1 hypothetical protein [Methylobacterium sp. J-030]
MGEVRTLTPRADSPARHALTAAETWALMAEALRASSSLAARAAAAIEAGAPPAECFAAVARLDEQNMAAGRIAASLMAAAVAANDAPGAA